MWKTAALPHDGRRDGGADGADDGGRGDGDDDSLAAAMSSLAAPPESPFRQPAVKEAADFLFSSMG